MTTPININALILSLKDEALEAADGGIDPANTYARLRYLKDHLEQCMETCKDAAMKEVEKFQKEGGLAKNGYRMELQNVPVQYAYGPEVESVEKLQKERKELARMGLRSGSPLVLAATGEVITPAVVTGGGGQTLKLTKLKYW